MTLEAVEHNYQPYGGSKTALLCRDDEVLLTGPAGTGKSRACLEKLHLLALMNDGCSLLIVRKTRESLGEAALKTYRTQVAQEAIANGTVKWYGGAAGQVAQYRYSNGSTITIGGMDVATKVMSTEYDVIYVQEAIELTKDDWEALTTRLRNGKISFQQIIADTNPSTPTHWLHKRCLEGTTTEIETKHEDNPVYFDQDGNLTDAGARYIGKLDNLTGVRYKRLRLGQWASAEGVIYENFGPAHLVDRFEIPQEWPRYWSVDFGYNHPFVCQRWAVDPDGRMYLYAEHFQTQRLVEDHCAAIKLSLLPDEPRPRAILCDHDLEDRKTFERHMGMSTKAAHKAVSTGIEAVASRLKVAGDGKPRIFIFRDAVTKVDESLRESGHPTCTADEIPGYSWADGGKEVPVKEFDDGCDALRYAVAHLDLKPVFRIRYMGD